MLKKILTLLVTLFVGSTQSKASDLPDEQEARKNRSVVICRKENVPVNEHLPLIESEADSTRRTTEQVAKRAISLCIVALKGEGVDKETISKLVKKYEAVIVFTEDESSFIGDPDPPEILKIQFAWRYECYSVMLWALGYVENLDRPEKICDAGKAVSILMENGPVKFIENSKLRPQSEILDAADLIYRYHWAVVDARINNRETPTKLEKGVVKERHYALNWLVGYCDQEWDDITTDT